MTRENKEHKKTVSFVKQFDYKGLIYGLDLFPEPIQLNFNKKANFPTIPGVCASILLFFLVLVYGIQKFNKLIFR